jgi:hypothetical protein
MSTMESAFALAARQSQNVRIRCKNLFPHEECHALHLIVNAMSYQDRIAFFLDVFSNWRTIRHVNNVDGRADADAKLVCVVLDNEDVTSMIFSAQHGPKELRERQESLGHNRLETEIFIIEGTSAQMTDYRRDLLDGWEERYSGSFVHA